MNFKDKRLFLNFALILSGIYLLNLCLYYFSNHILDSDFVYYIHSFLNRSLYFLLPTASAAVIFTSYPFIGYKKSLISAIALSSVRAIYSLPYFFILYALNGNTIQKSLLLSFLSSIAEICIAYIFMLMIFFLLKLIVIKRGDISLKEAMIKKTKLDFSNPVSFAFILISCLIFLYLFTSEIVNTISFIIDYSFTFTTEELLYTLVSYLLSIAIPLLCYATLAFIKNKIIESRYCA